MAYYNSEGKIIDPMYQPCNCVHSANTETKIKVLYATSIQNLQRDIDLTLKEIKENNGIVKHVEHKICSKTSSGTHGPCEPHISSQEIFTVLIWWEEPIKCKLSNNQKSSEGQTNVEKIVNKFVQTVNKYSEGKNENK